MLICSNTDPLSIQDTVYGEAHSQTQSIFGPAGYREYALKYKLSDFHPVYGNYIILINSGTQITIKTDHFGLSRLYAYRHADFWAISDSIQDLAEKAREIGLPVTPYAPAAYGFYLKNAMGQQLASYRTPIAEIQLIPHWQNVLIQNTKLSFPKKDDVKWSPNLSETFTEATRFFLSLLKSYLDQNMNPVMRMSAGLDSRCTLAAILAIENYPKLGSIGLQTSDAPEFAHEKGIVLDLLGKTPFYEEKNIKSHSPLSWAGWKRRFLGGQAHIAEYPQSGPPYPRFTGACGELAREFYSWDGSPATLEFFGAIPTVEKALLYTDIETALSDFDAQEKGLLTAAVKHYHMFRNRFHFGRDHTATIFNYPPLVYSLLYAGTGKRDKTPLHRMIYELGGEELLSHPFDSIEKAYSGPIPAEWTRIRFSVSDLDERTLFRGHAGGEGGNGDHREYPPGDLCWRRGSLISKAFIRDSELAINRVSARGLMEADFIRSAKVQLDKLKAQRSRGLSGFYPAVMAALALDMTAGSSD